RAGLPAHRRGAALRHPAAAGQDSAREHDRALAAMTQKLDTLQATLQTVLGDALKSLVRDRGEITITVPAARYLAAAQALRDDPALKFEQLLDLCGVDYSDYANESRDGPRYCVVSHLLS